MRRVNRSLKTILLPLAVASLAASCSALDTDTVARVGDAELSADDLEERAIAAGFSVDPAIDSETARAIIQQWIQETAIGNGDFDVEAVGEVTGPRAAARFNAGLAESGVVCPAFIVTQTPEEADSALAELQSGADFDDVFAASNIDPGLTDTGGRLDCFDRASLVDAADNPEVAVLFELSADRPFDTSPLLDPGGNPIAGIVLAFRTYDELQPDEIALVSTALQSSIAVEAIDVEVDSRYGYFDPQTASVIALG